MEIKGIQEQYKQRKNEIKQRLKEFSEICGDNLFYELCFCALTPQSNAVKCDECVGILKSKNFIKDNINLEPILRPKTRFYKNKSSYLIYNKGRYGYIKKIILNKNKNDLINNKEIRVNLIKNSKGLGYKEASHFLRNIGYRNLAILDRHILKNLKKLNVIKEIPQTLTPKRYIEIEEKFQNFSKKINIPMDELDLLFWSMQTGKVFK